jgi:hypothetical protein
MLREYLVFQIVQFVSAPFIAAVAYYLISPSSTAATVALAFAAGFASETVLLYVRAAVEKVAPAPARSLRAGSVVGELEDEDGNPVAKGIVVIVGSPGLTAETNDLGQFVINDIPAGEWAVEATHPADKRRVLARILVDADKTFLLPRPLRFAVQ